MRTTNVKQTITQKLGEVVVKTIPDIGVVELGIVGDTAAIMVELTPDQCDELAPLLTQAAQDIRGGSQ